MMHELKKRDYPRIRSIFKELEWNLITGAVIQGTVPGRVYADNVEDPRTAFMCTVDRSRLNARRLTMGRDTCPRSE